jgi:PilZ domain-containing protein
MLTMPETQIHGQRRAPRYYLGGVVELTDLDSGRMKVALVRAVSLYGCFVKTEMPVEKAARVALKIAHSGTHFSATGRVVNCVKDQSNRGLGIEFTEIDSIDKTHLEACLTELAAAQKLPPVPSP